MTGEWQNFPGMGHPVALINPQAPLLDLLTYAVTTRNADHLDLKRFSSVTTLLLLNGCDVLRVTEQQALQLPKPTCRR